MIRHAWCVYVINCVFHTNTRTDEGETGRGRKRGDKFKRKIDWWDAERIAIHQKPNRKKRALVEKRAKKKRVHRAFLLLREKCFFTVYCTFFNRLSSLLSHYMHMNMYHTTWYLKTVATKVRHSYNLLHHIKQRQTSVWKKGFLRRRHKPYAYHERNSVICSFHFLSPSQCLSFSLSTSLYIHYVF